MSSYAIRINACSMIVHFALNTIALFSIRCFMSNAIFISRNYGLFRVINYAVRITEDIWRSSFRYKSEST